MGIKEFRGHRAVHAAWYSACYLLRIERDRRKEIAMSKQRSYSALIETEPVRATFTGTSHRLTVKLNLQTMTAEVSNSSLPVVNGDRVAWDFKDPNGNRLFLGNRALAIVFDKGLASIPGNFDIDTGISMDINEDAAPPLSSHAATYSVQLNGAVVAFSSSLTDPPPGMSPQLVIDGMGKPPDKRPDGRDGTGHPSWHRRRKG
jgi:hypothetical protein